MSEIIYKRGNEAYNLKMIGNIYNFPGGCLERTEMFWISPKLVSGDVAGAPALPLSCPMHGTG
jgi:hypothetical protein